MLAVIAGLTDGGLRDARAQHASLLAVRPKAHVLDDATVARLQRVTADSLDWCDVYDEQLQRWRAGRLTAAQTLEVDRLVQVTSEARTVHTQILAVADELAQGTIERQLAKSDIELGLEYVLGRHRP